MGRITKNSTGYIGGIEVWQKATDQERAYIAKLIDTIAILHNCIINLETQVKSIHEAVANREGL